MSEKRLTQEIFEQYLADDESVDLTEFTEVDDEAAEKLATWGGFLRLDGLTILSEAAAESFGRHSGWLRLNGLTSLSDAAAESLSQHEGPLFLNGLTSLSDAAANALEKHEGLVNLTLSNLPSSAAEILSQKAVGDGDLPRSPTRPVRPAGTSHVRFRSRYPRLTQHLSTIEKFAIILLWLQLALCGVAAVVAMTKMNEEPLLGWGGLVAALLSALVIYVGYLVVMVFLGFVTVTIDVEKNTSRLLDNSQFAQKD